MNVSLNIMTKRKIWSPINDKRRYKHLTKMMHNPPSQNNLKHYSLAKLKRLLILYKNAWTTVTLRNQGLSTSEIKKMTKNQLVNNWYFSGEAKRIAQQYL